MIYWYNVNSNKSCIIYMIYRIIVGKAVIGSSDFFDIPTGNHTHTVTTDTNLL